MASSASGETVLNIDKIANQYRKWFISEPFEVDEAVFFSISPLIENPKSIVAKFAAINNNKDLQTSSCLSRITPLAVWASNLKNESDFKTAIDSEVCLTHSNKVTREACFIYCSALQTILNHQDDKDRIQVTIERIAKLAQSDCISNFEIATWLSQSVTLLNNFQYINNILKDL